MRILLVEDDPLIGHGVSQSLIEANHTCQWVKDGKLVMAALDGDAFDAVLLDQGLPGMDGTSVLRQLRERGKDIPVISITARDGVQDRIEGLDLGADDYLLKPFPLGELQARLRAVARRHVGTGSPQLATALLQGGCSPPVWPSECGRHAGFHVARRCPLGAGRRGSG